MDACANQYKNQRCDNVFRNSDFSFQFRGSYGKRITYRAGAYYNRDYMNIRGNQVRDYGVGVGVSLPVPAGKTFVNLGVEYKHRESSPAKLVTEDYINITLGVTFNEMWFWQNKIR